METVQSQFCLDMMKVGWVGNSGSQELDCGILLEIEPAGGLVQTTVAIPRGSEITLDTGLNLVAGHVTNCEQDAYGYNVNFAIDVPASKWYPQYIPAMLYSADGR